MPMVPGCQRPPIPTPTGQAVHPSKPIRRHPPTTTASAHAILIQHHRRRHPMLLFPTPKPSKPRRCPIQSLPPSTVKQIVKLCSHGAKSTQRGRSSGGGSTMSTKLVASHRGGAHIHSPCDETSYPSCPRALGQGLAAADSNGAPWFSHGTVWTSEAVISKVFPPETDG